MNWKTTACGCISAAALFMTSYPAHFNQLELDIAKFVMIGGLAGMGISAKDASTHSTQAEVMQATGVAVDKVEITTAPKPPKGE